MLRRYGVSAYTFKIRRQSMTSQAQHGSQNGHGDDHTDAGRPGVITMDEVKTPSMYVVVVHNDPFTPREFVVTVLEKFFQKNADEAQRIMIQAHRGGHSAVGVYTYE